MSKTKKITLIAIILASILLITIIINGFISSLWLDKTIERRFLDNKQIFERIKQICSEEKIDYIGDSDNPNLEKQDYEMIRGYFVYADEALKDDIKSELKDILTKFKSYKIHSINVYNNGIAFDAKNFFKSIELVYTEENESIDFIIERNFCREARYIDDKWYLLIQ